jgi:hypothetical protein
MTTLTAVLVQRAARAGSSFAQRTTPPGPARQTSSSKPTALPPGSTSCTAVSSRCAARDQRPRRRAGRALLVLGGRQVARGDAIAVAILQRDAQQRHRLGARREIAQARAHRQRAGGIGRRERAELPYVIGAQVAAQGDRQADRGIEPRQRCADRWPRGERVAIEVDELCRERQREHTGSGGKRPPATIARRLVLQRVDDHRAVRRGDLRFVARNRRNGLADVDVHGSPTRRLRVAGCSSGRSYTGSQAVPC